MAPEIQDSAFVKQLASSDRKTRDTALDSLRAYLRSQTGLTPLDLLKIWKGLFYCMWMADRPRTQQQLARDLAGLIDELPRADAVPLFLATFWQTMAREWNGVDSLRLDKFLYLARCYVGAGFQFCSRHGWSRQGAIEEYLAVLAETPLNPTDVKVPNGMRYHVIDVYVDELEKVGAGDDESVPVEKLLSPLETLGERSTTKAVKDRVTEALQDERVRRWRGEERPQHAASKMAQAGRNGCSDADDEWEGIDD